ncbi:peptidylprolyl isomerase [Brevundimonas kwangchunensis]|uniref:Peptidyl-prolyl cis-trans isomerase n=1 Tax=Brevundimonas kwangchunensis TaxID=322163 RepID=A0ABN1H1Q7_9CAUL
MRSSALLAAVAAMVLAAPAAASAQTAQSDWRTVAPENLLVIDTAKGRIIVELDPRVAPQSVNRVRTLADQGFYDGLKFHRVIANFMAQTGDPEGTGAGGSDLPDLSAEFEFRRGRADGFYPVIPGSPLQYGLIGSIPVQTQPDAQMMITADFRTTAVGRFCPGVAGMARNGASVDSANSQFFLMTGARENLNGQYTVFGRVLIGLDVVEALNAGSEANNGTVANPDVMTRTRTAAAMPAGERPAVRVMNASSPAFGVLVEQKRTERGARFNVCDIQPPAELVN